MLAGRRSSRRRGQRRGAALVEFAMVVPVVFLFMFGMIELSRYVMVQQALTSASQRACRKAVLDVPILEFIGASRRTLRVVAAIPFSCAETPPWDAIASCHVGYDYIASDTLKTCPTTGGRARKGPALVGFQ